MYYQLHWNILHCDMCPNDAPSFRKQRKCIHVYMQLLLQEATALIPRPTHLPLELLFSLHRI